MSDWWLETNLRALRRSKGACPPEELLAKFLGGELEEEDLAKVLGHVSACGVCDSLLERMKPFDDPEAWQEADRRVAGRSSSFMGDHRHLAAATLHLPLVVACSVILFLAYPAYRGLVSRPVMHEAAPARALRPMGIESAKLLELDSTRGVVGENTLTERDKVLILSFFVPIQTGLRHSAAILDAAGKSLAQTEITSYDGKGNFYLVCDRRLFTRGYYVLSVKGSGKAPREFRFPFTL